MLRMIRELTLDELEHVTGGTNYCPPPPPPPCGCPPEHGNGKGKGNNGFGHGGNDGSPNGKQDDTR